MSSISTIARTATGLPLFTRTLPRLSGVSYLGRTVQINPCFKSSRLFSVLLQSRQPHQSRKTCGSVRKMTTDSPKKDMRELEFDRKRIINGWFYESPIFDAIDIFQTGPILERIILEFINKGVDINYRAFRTGDKMGPRGIKDLTPLDFFLKYNRTYTNADNEFVLFLRKNGAKKTKELDEILENM